MVGQRRKLYKICIYWLQDNQLSYNLILWSDPMVRGGDAILVDLFNNC